jgi:hypothetical protein
MSYREYKETCERMRDSGWLSHVLAAPNISAAEATSADWLNALQATKTYRAFVGGLPNPPFPHTATPARLQYVDANRRHDEPVTIDDAGGLIMRVHPSSGQRLVGFLSDLPPGALVREGVGEAAAQTPTIPGVPKKENKEHLKELSSVISFLRVQDDSEFYGKIRRSIEDAEIPFWDTVHCSLEKQGGYEGEIQVTIADADTFEAGQHYHDPTRFPARLRAAATALRDCGQFGSFLLTHRHSRVTIDRLYDTSAPTGDAAELERRVVALLKAGPLPQPLGIRKPARSSHMQHSFARDPRVVAWVLSHAKGRCEACDKPAPFERGDGTPFLEVHHVRSLADEGSDRISNAVAICPNCHRRFHYSTDRATFVASIYDRVQRLVSE